MQVQGAVDGAVEAVATRAEQIDALPDFGKVTGLTAVESEKTIYFTPLRSGELAQRATLTSPRASRW